MSAADLLRLLALSAIWGGSFMLMRVAAPALGAISTSACRVALAALALLLYLRLRGIAVGWAEHRRTYLVVGVVNSALPFTLYAFAGKSIPASYSAIINAAAPLFSALIAWLWLADRLSPGRLAGLLLAFAGVALVAGAGPVEPSPEALRAMGACLLAAACYGFAACYLKKAGGGAPPLGIAAATQAVAAGALLPLVPLAGVPSALAPEVLASVVALALVCTALAYLLYFRLIASAGPTRALTVTFLMPLFGMAWGALVLDETITLTMLGGCALILVGTGLVLVRPPTAAAEGKTGPPSGSRK